MELFTKENGDRTSNMARVCSLTQTEILMKESSAITCKTGQEDVRLLTVLEWKANGIKTSLNKENYISTVE